jgi:aminopeptidase YwaD
MKILNGFLGLVLLAGAVACAEEKEPEPNHLQALCAIGSRFTDTSKITHVRDKKIDYITRELSGYGYKVFQEKFSASHKGRDLEGINLFVEKTGSRNPDKVIELGAHYDTVADSQGADDNISGTVAVLELAERFSKLETDKTIRFCFFDLEELGTLGSEYHVKELLRKKGRYSKQTHEGIMVFEMIAFTNKKANSQKAPKRIPGVFDPPTTANFIAICASKKSIALGKVFEKACENLEPKLKHYSIFGLEAHLPDLYRSDHGPYWQNDMKALMISDTAEFRNPNYHKSSDVIKTLDLKFMRGVINASFEALKVLSGS